MKLLAQDLRRDYWREFRKNALGLTILSHVPTNVGFGRSSNFCSNNARLHSTAVFHCVANDCHNLRLVAADSLETDWPKFTT